MSLPRALLPCLLALTLSAKAGVVISEIMFHPAGIVENLEEEWLELYNPDAFAVDASGWQFSKGVTYTLPPGTTLQAGGYLVVAANVAAFQAAHPGFTGTVIGGWTGRLSNSGEQVQFDNAAGNQVCEVSYADEGDWALRGRGALSFFHRGWDWFSEADGGGKTLELRNPVLGIGSGQNWGFSAAIGGSPGAANSIASTNIAPLIKGAKHRPEIPRSTDPIVVSAEFEDEGSNLTTTLRWRVDGGAWQNAPMVDTDGDGDREAIILAKPNLTVIEYYVEASDGLNTRTWPAPARTSDIGVLPETFGQMTNALLQVDNGFDPNATFRTAAASPIYRLIMTAAERAELLQIGTTSGHEDSDAAMNGTFISHDGTGVKVRYRCGFRNRGQSSALGPPNNYHVGFASDDRWNSRASFGLNCRFPYAQALGQALMARAGVATQDAAIVRVRVNGADLSEPTAPTATIGRMYGRYVRVEGRGADWAEHHYPLDPDGNFYRLDDHIPGVAGVPPGNLAIGEFRYEGTDPLSYADTFIKETNKDANAFGDLINFCRIVSAPVSGGTGGQLPINNTDYPGAVATVLDLDNFYRFIAADAMIGNTEGGLTSGRADDASIYSGLLDQHFRFIPHDLDTVFDIGDTTGGVSRNIFSYDGGNSPGTGVLGLTRLFNHPQLVPRYYATLLELVNDWSKLDTAGTRIIDPRIAQLIDQIMSGWVPLTDGVTQNRSINDIKAYVVAHCTAVNAAIQQNYSLVTTVNGTDTPEGYRRTLDGSATFSGNFNVAKTYSVTVNGQLATWNYRTNTGTGTTAGTWSYVVPVGGGSALHPGLNRVVVKFWDGVGGTGKVIDTRTVDVLYQPATATYTNVSGTLSAGSLRLTAPATFIPGKPFLVRADVLDGAGKVDRAVWNGTVNLSGSAAGLTLPAIQLYNGTGSALVTAGGGGGQANDVIFPLGSAWFYVDDGSDQGTAWRAQSFPSETSAPWKSGNAELGVADGDEATVLLRNGTVAWRTYYFRRHFTLPDPIPAYAALKIRLRCDDGAIVYVNGQEVVLTTGMTSGMAFTAGCAFARDTNSSPGENTYEEFNLPLGLFVPGDNTIAVEVHNAASGSQGDISFDVEMLGTYPAADPGNFTLTGNYSAPGANFSTQRTLTSLTGSPAITTTSGTLASGTTTWSGIIQVTGDVTVPADGTLNIAAGTHVLVDGDAVAGSASGRRIIVNGALNSQGTFAQPVTITATNTTDRWGGLSFVNAQPSTLSYTLLNHAGHTTGVGHTGRGPMLRLASANLSLLDSVLADGPAKAIYTSGTCDLTIQRSLIERMITGPELGDGCALLLEDSNIQRILPDYRESNAAAPDDEDCLYVHNGDGRSVIVRRAVFARCGDDVFDCLGGPIIVEDSILREGWDKGMSLLNNDLTISRTQIIHCDKAIVPKSQNADTRTVIATHVTIVSEDHNTSQSPWGYAVAPSNPDPDTPSTGFYTQNKSGQSNPAATLAVVAKNCIIQAQSPVLIDAPYSAANTVVTYSDLALLDGSAFAWPGAGNLGTDPLFVGTASGNYRLTAASPCRDAGDPTTFDADNSRADMGALPYAASTGAGSIAWTPAGGPYRLTANTTVPAGTTLTIAAGTSVYFDQNVRLTVNGRILAQGSPGQRITFSHVPGTSLLTDVDPIKNGTQTGAPKWGGIRVFDSLTQENIFRYCDFINAQGTDPGTSENYGSVGFIRSWGWVDNCTWAGTHLRMCYGRNASLTVTHCVFPDMFLFDATLSPPDNPPTPGRIEQPADFLTSADNRMEPLKVEHPTTDPELAGQTGAAGAFPNGLPRDGRWRVYYNQFNGNRGHQDVFDADSGRWGQSGQFVLDCRYNHFRGLSGDEHIDLGGDAYIASNIFERATKDQWTTDAGYSNAISSGDKGTGTTIMVARNVAFDLDHVINLKASTATIFEHNTVANIHPDFTYIYFTPNVNVKCAPVNFFIPEDVNPTNGDGAYMGFNLISNVPRLFSGADASASGPVTSKIEFNHNLLDQIASAVIGPNHPGGIFGGTYGPNSPGAPGFIDPANKNYALRADSLARGSTPLGFDYGASVAEWAYIGGGPNHGSVTASTDASFVIGGPGIVAYKWRLDGGAWSAPIQIGAGGVLPRNTPTIRQATLQLPSLTPGSHTLEVLGQDMAGNWQDADPARTLEGLPQTTPTSRTWTVDTNILAVRLNEVLADSATLADTVEVQNLRAGPVSLTGWSLTDDPLVPNKLPLSGVLGTRDYAFFSSPALALDKDGDTVYLFQGATLRDSITFGAQIADKTIGRNVTGAWVLCSKTLGSANTPIPVGDPSTVRISEWLASGQVLYESDWIELQNTNPNPVALEGLRLTDNRAGNASAFVFPPLSFLAGSGYLRLVADGTNTPGHLPFGLDAEYEGLSLLAADGTLLDTVAFYPQTTDWSMGRDNSGLLTFYELPTRGFTNGATDPAYANALAILRGLRITEVMFNPPGGINFEFVELRNIGATTLQLGGVKFVEGIDFTFPAFSLAPGQELVVVRNRNSFRNRYGDGANIAGDFPNSALDNSGETLALQLPPPFDANVLTFRFSDTWQPITDGLGKSLDVISALLPASAWGERETWSESASLYGSPGGVVIRPPDHLGAWSSYYGVAGLLTDNDSDSLLALTEFAIGSDPNDPTGTDGVGGAPLLTRTVSGQAQLHLLLPEHPGAVRGHGQPQITYTVFASTDLVAWTPIATKTFATEWSGTASVVVGANTNGYLPVTITDFLAYPAGSRFLRLQVTATP